MKAKFRGKINMLKNTYSALGFCDIVFIPQEEQAFESEPTAPINITAP